jgi:hypothetical protein
MRAFATTPGVQVAKTFTPHDARCQLQTSFVAISIDKGVTAAG